VPNCSIAFEKAIDTITQAKTAMMKQVEQESRLWNIIHGNAIATTSHARKAIMYDIHSEA